MAKESSLTTAKLDLTTFVFVPQLREKHYNFILLVFLLWMTMIHRRFQLAHPSSFAGAVVVSAGLVVLEDIFGSCLSPSLLFFV